MNWAECAGQKILTSAEDVSPVSSRPIWFPMTNTTAVPAGYRADNNILVCVSVSHGGNWWTAAVRALRFNNLLM